MNILMSINYIHLKTYKQQVSILDAYIVCQFVCFPRPAFLCASLPASVNLTKSFKIVRQKGSCVHFLHDQLIRTYVLWYVYLSYIHVYHVYNKYQLCLYNLQSRMHNLHLKVQHCNIVYMNIMYNRI